MHCCNDNTPHPTTDPQGLAIIHPASPHTFPSFQLHFVNVPTSAVGSAVFQTASNEVASLLQQCRVIVHRDGDLRRSSAGINDLPPLFKFEQSEPLKRTTSGDGDVVYRVMVPVPELLFDAPERASTDVGIMGRRVTVLTSQNGILLGDGIIGWSY